MTHFLCRRESFKCAFNPISDLLEFLRNFLKVHFVPLVEAPVNAFVKTRSGIPVLGENGDQIG